MFGCLICCKLNEVEMVFSENRMCCPCLVQNREHELRYFWCALGLYQNAENNVDVNHSISFTKPTKHIVKYFPCKPVPLTAFTRKQTQPKVPN